MSRKPQLLGTPKERRVPEKRAKGWSIDKISSQLNIPRKQVQSLVALINREAEARRVPFDAMPPLPENATAVQHMEMHTRWLKAQLDKLTAGGAPLKDSIAISGQYLRAIRSEARLKGSPEVTAAQVLRSADFQRALGALRRAIGERVDIWEALNAEFAVITGLPRPLTE
jgi:hypothetical protein